MNNEMIKNILNFVFKDKIDLKTFSSYIDVITAKIHKSFEDECIFSTFYQEQSINCFVINNKQNILKSRNIFEIHNYLELYKNSRDPEDLKIAMHSFIEMRFDIRIDEESFLNNFKELLNKKYYVVMTDPDLWFGANSLTGAIDKIDPEFKMNFPRDPTDKEILDNIESFKRKNKKKIVELDLMFIDYMTKSF